MVEESCYVPKENVFLLLVRFLSSFSPLGRMIWWMAR
jgi:hypothetical protein